MTKITKDIKQYSKLLLSVGQQGRGLSQKQSLTPLTCGKLIKQLMDEEDEDKSSIAKRLDLGRQKEGTNIYKKRDLTQLNNFLALLDISIKSHYMSGWGWEGHPAIPFTTVAKLSSLTHDEQDKILQAAYSDEKKKMILSKDVDKIKKWRSENPDLSIDECITKVLKLKVVPVTHIVVCEIYEKLKNFIKINSDHKEKLLEILKSNISGEFYELETTDILVSISMDEQAYKIFHEQQYKKGVHFTAFLNTFLEDKID